MKTRQLGTTGILVSQAILGCGEFGGVGARTHLIGRGLTREASFASLDEAVRLGINVLDTAYGYAGGASSRFIGEWLRVQPADVRRSLHIATKVGKIVEPDGVRVDLSPHNIIPQLSLSLEQLQLSHVTFCLTHAPDERTPIESTLEALTDAIESGQLSHIGACNIDAKQLAAAMKASARLGLPRYEWVQNEYNLLNRGDERELFAVCAEHGLGYTPYSPIAGGVLSGKYGRGMSPPADSRLALLPGGTISNATFDAIERLDCKAALLDCSTGALALAWAMNHPRVTAAVCGPAKQAEHLRFLREALAIELSESERAEIGAWFEAT